jgi:enoyl-CoA hydratase/carnithine racemase
MPAFETLIYEKRGPVANITINRPQALNVYNIKMRDELFQILNAVKNDAEVRVSILKGAGEKAFCAGADLSEFLSAPPPVFARKARFDRDIWGLFLSVPQPFIAVLHGYVLGSGIEMALCCDIRIAADDAKFGLPEVALGIIPAAGATQTLPRVIGRARALDMLLTGRWIGADEARAAGLVSHVVPRVKLAAESEALAARIAAFDAAAVAAARQAVKRGLDLPLPAGLELEKRLSFALAG